MNEQTGKRIYLEFDAPENDRNLHQKSNRVTLFGNFLNRILPKANPHFEELYGTVTRWIIEIDQDRNYTMREIGFDEAELPVVIAPYKDNYGYWTDNVLEIDDYLRFNGNTISKSDFETEWKNALDRINDQDFL